MVNIPIELAAGQHLPVAVQAQYLRILSNVGATESVRIAIDDGVETEWPAGVGERLPKPFKRLTFYNPSANVMDVVLAISDGQVDDSRLTLQNAEITGILNELRGDTTPENSGDEKVVGVAAGLVLASNDNRKGAIVQAKSTNTGIIYIGFDNTLTSTHWVVELLPGASWPIDDYRGDIYAIATAANQKLGWGEW